MGLLTDLFVAAEDEIDDAVLEEGPADRFPTVEAKRVSDVKITSLNGIATGRSFDLDDGGFQLYPEVPLIRDAGEEGPWLFRLPPPLLAALATADEAKLGEINEAWARTEEWQLDGVTDPDDTRWLVDGIARLARNAEMSGKNVYLWMSL
jgi:hypothetical protein